MSSPEREKTPGFLIVITGPSAGAGKDAVGRAVEKRGNFTRIVTYVTRDQRPGEVDGVDYRFRTRKRFLELKREGFFLETNQYRGEFYGTPKDETLRVIKQGKDVLLRVDVNGAREIKERIPEAVTVFVYATMDEMRGRLIKRGREGMEEIKGKLSEAEKEMEEKDKDYFDYRVYNREEKLEEAIEEVLEIIKKEKIARRNH